MTLALNKSSLKQQRDHLAMYRRFLPSLDLKRQQLLSALKLAKQELAEVNERIDAKIQQLEQLFPLLGSSTLSSKNLKHLVRVCRLAIDKENILGATLPTLGDIEFEVAEYSTFATPFWVDTLVTHLKQMAELRVQRQIRETRVEILFAASRKITQRVNLFDKVLIPEAIENIRQIVIFLSDQERAAVVRSKLAKKKHHDRVEEMTSPQRLS